ncbi:MAG TPA: HypC/HybG/HupF family hydrogenase formation chaperone [Bryobacteraceae bacterium]|nr:HypC/HybG/HupF family hydrogenase formation chaperone [Bryobacteraceae bacterium]
MPAELPGKILEIQVVRNNRLGLVEFGDTRRPIFLDLVPDAKVGDYVTVHVGFATGRISEAEALKDSAEAYEEPGTAEHDLQLEEAGPAMRRRVKPR